MKIRTLGVLIPAILAAGAVQAADDPAKVQDILSKNACLACHAVDKKVVGPAYKDVVDKHKDDADAAAVLTKHIRAGSVGVWGPIPMPPNPNISDEDLKVVVDWILAGAPQ